MQWNIIIDYQSPLKKLVIPVLDILAETRNFLHTFCISVYGFESMDFLELT